jgi:hypothetical protein
MFVILSLGGNNFRVFDLAYTFPVFLRYGMRADVTTVIFLERKDREQQQQQLPRNDSSSSDLCLVYHFEYFA